MTQDKKMSKRLNPSVDRRKGAIFDDTNRYRYKLWRSWDTNKPTIAFIMLNPSTADESENDPTIRRCLGYAKDWGYGRLVVGNLFAYRTSDPSNLRNCEDPVGPENDQYLHEICETADMVICAWGVGGDLYNREQEVTNKLNFDLYALDTTKDGHPNHPLYQPADTEPEPFELS
jgi:hypothetical protein